MAEPSRSAARAGGPLPPLIGLGRDLRARGLPVGTGRILTFVRAVAALGLTDRDSLYWAGRASMIARRDDLEAYDETFEHWYRSLRSTDDLRVELHLPTPPPEGEDGLDPGYEPDDLEVRVEAASEWHGADDDDEVDRGRRVLDPHRGERRRGAAIEVVRRAHRRGTRARGGADQGAAPAGAGRAHAPHPSGVEGGAVRPSPHVATLVAHAG